MPCRLVGHPCPPGREGQRGSLFEQLPQLADLPIGDDHRRPPVVGGCVRQRLSDGSSNCRWTGVLIAALHSLVNCGGFPKAFAGSILSDCGLLTDQAKALNVQRLLRENYPEEPHADCDVWAISQ